MTVFGKPLSEYTQFCKLFLILIPIVGIARLALSLAGEPNSTAKWISVSAALWAAALFYAVRIYIRGFGSYKQLLVICFLLNLTAQAVIIFGIVLAIFSGQPNIYSAPEYAFGSDGATWLHAGAHLVIGTIAGTLAPWLIGSLVLFVTSKMSKPNPRIRSVA